MLAGLMELLAGNALRAKADPWPTVLKAAIESYALHLRNLCEFLFDEYSVAPELSHTASASDYLDRANWAPNRVAAAATFAPAKVWSAASNEVAHLTYRRTAPGTNWHVLWGATVLMTLNVFVNLAKEEPKSRRLLTPDTVMDLKESIRRGLNAALIPTGPNTAFE